MVPFNGCAGWSLHLVQGGYVAAYLPAMTLLFFRKISVGVYINSERKKSQEKIALFPCRHKGGGLFLFQSRPERMVSQCQKESNHRVSRRRISGFRNSST
jgi:hypothetical protein